MISHPPSSRYHHSLEVQTFDCCWCSGRFGRPMSGDIGKKVDVMELLLPLEQLSFAEKPLSTPCIHALVERVEDENKPYNTPNKMDVQREQVTEDEGVAANSVLSTTENVETEVTVIRDRSRNGHSATLAKTAAEIEGEVLPLACDDQDPTRSYWSYQCVQIFTALTDQAIAHIPVEINKFFHG